MSCYGRRRVDIHCCSRNEVIYKCGVRLVAVVANLMRAEDRRDLFWEAIAWGSAWRAQSYMVGV
jgi:hypothetical protein